MATDQAGRSGHKVGELAAATGLTVRTLHYFEEIGLLVPSGRTAAGHRLYDEHDLARLYQICLLRRVGLPLADIGRALDDPAWNLRAAFESHIGQLDRRIETAGRLRSRLAGLLGSTGATRAGLSDHLLTVLEEMTMLDATVQRRIMLLVYADIGAAHDWLVRVFGLGPGKLTRDDQGQVVHGELQAGDGVIWLHPVQDDYRLASPQSVGLATACVAVLVDDVDAHYRHAVAEGATAVHEPVDHDYGYRGYSARDLGGHLWSFMKPVD